MEKTVITIARSYGSGGRTFGKGIRCKLLRQGDFADGV